MYKTYPRNCGLCVARLYSNRSLRFSLERAPCWFLSYQGVKIKRIPVCFVVIYFCKSATCYSHTKLEATCALLASRQTCNCLQKLEMTGWQQQRKLPLQSDAKCNKRLFLSRFEFNCRMWTVNYDSTLAWLNSISVSTAITERTTEFPPIFCIN